MPIPGTDPTGGSWGAALGGGIGRWRRGGSARQAEIGQAVEHELHRKRREQHAEKSGEHVDSGFAEHAFEHPGGEEQRENHDPIERVKKDLLAAGVEEDKLKDIEKVIRAQVAESADFAEKSPEPEAHDLYTDVLVEEY